jgi:hypothetical protein
MTHGNAEEEEDIGDSSFLVLSISELQAAQLALNEDGALYGSGVGPSSLSLELEVQTSVLLDDGTKVSPTL